MLYCAILVSDKIAFSNPESDVVWRVSRLLPWPPSWILKLNNLAIPNLHVTLVPPIKFLHNLTYCLGGDVVWRITRWQPSSILEQNDFSNTEFPLYPNSSPLMFKLNQIYHSGADVIWRLSRWLPWGASQISEQNHFSNSKFPMLRCLPPNFCSIQLTVQEQITTEDFQDGPCAGHHGYHSDGDVENVKSYWQT